MFYSADEIIDKTVILCPECKGRGTKIVRGTESNYFMFEGDIRRFPIKTCPLCHGDRVMQVRLERVQKLREIIPMEV